MISAVIFDMDGVLMDSGPAVIAGRRKLLAEFGVDFDSLPDPHGESHKGTSGKDFLALVKAQHPEVSIDPDKYVDMQWQHIYPELVAQNHEADSDLVEFLDSIRSHQIPCAVATSGSSAGAMEKLRILGIADYFDLVLSGSDVTKHKPDPEVYHLATERLHAEPAHCIVFEDSLPGVQAAVAAGCKVVGFTKYSNQKDIPGGTAKTINSWGKISLEQLESLINT